MAIILLSMMILVIVHHVNKLIGSLTREPRITSPLFRSRMKCQISPLVFQSPSVPLLPLDTQGHEGDVEEYDDTSDLAADDDYG